MLPSLALFPIPFPELWPQNQNPAECVWWWAFSKHTSTRFLNCLLVWFFKLWIYYRAFLLGHFFYIINLFGKLFFYKKHLNYFLIVSELPQKWMKFILMMKFSTGRTTHSHIRPSCECDVLVFIIHPLLIGPYEITHKNRRYTDCFANYFTYGYMECLPNENVYIKKIKGICVQVEIFLGLHVLSVLTLKAQEIRINW